MANTEQVKFPRPAPLPSITHYLSPDSAPGSISVSCGDFREGENWNTSVLLVTCENCLEVLAGSGSPRRAAQARDLLAVPSAPFWEYVKEVVTLSSVRSKYKDAYTTAYSEDGNGNGDGGDDDDDVVVKVG